MNGAVEDVSHRKLMVNDSNSKIIYNFTIYYSYEPNCKRV